jgi:hypothetical protein
MNPTDKALWHFGFHLGKRGIRAHLSWRRFKNEQLGIIEETEEANV